MKTLRRWSGTVEGVCGKADNRWIDLPRIRVFEFSPGKPEDTEGAEELNEQAEKRVGRDLFTELLRSFA